MAACVAVDAKKAMHECTALEIGTDLTFYEAGNGRALPSRPSQVGFELFAISLGTSPTTD